MRSAHWASSIIILPQGSFCLSSFLLASPFLQIITYYEKVIQWRHKNQIKDDYDAHKQCLFLKSASFLIKTFLKEIKYQEEHCKIKAPVLWHLNPTPFYLSCFSVCGFLIVVSVFSGLPTSPSRANPFLGVYLPLWGALGWNPALSFNYQLLHNKPPPNAITWRKYTLSLSILREGKPSSAALT